jgi:hypothetical protein
VMHPHPTTYSLPKIETRLGGLDQNEAFDWSNRLARRAERAPEGSRKRRRLGLVADFVGYRAALLIGLRP